jgi:hypothetical protein
MRKTLLMVLASLMAVLGLAGTASASTYNGQQLRFYDESPDQGINSIKISGTNQDGVGTTACIPTPHHTTDFPNWWWSGHADVFAYSDSHCTSQRGHLWINVPVSFDGYYWRCLGSKPPNYSDWSC